MSERFRSLFQNPDKMAKEIGISEGKVVADIGAGKGFLTIPASAIVGKGGLVYSVEPDPNRSKLISERVAAEGLENVRVLTTGAEKLGEIPSGSVDAAFSVFSIHHFKDKAVSLAEIRRILKSGGTFYAWDRVPSTIVRHGTRPAELEQLSGAFAKFELLNAQRTVKARFTK